MKRISIPRKFALPVAMAGASLALASCGGGGAELTTPLETMIEFEAKWQCDVTRFSFASTADIDAKRDETRARFGVSAEDHKIFTDMFEADEELRAVVATAADNACGVPSDA